MRRRRRDMPYQLGFGHGKTHQFKRAPGCADIANPDIDQTVNLGSLPGSQVTDSESHQWPPPRGNTADVGGEFWTQRKYVRDVPLQISASAEGSIVDGCIARNDYYHGPIWPLTPTDMAFPSITTASDSVLNQLGAKAVANCKPTNAILDLSTFLAEILREGIPRVPFKEWKESTEAARKKWPDVDHLKKGSDEYLNYQFGWIPTANDINSVAGTLANADSIIRQYRRDAGRVVRRTWRFPEERSSNFLSYQNFSSGYYRPQNAWLNRAGRSFTINQVDEVTTKTWFSGAFTYHLPEDFPALDKMTSMVDEFRALTDTDITPETVWNAIPWSWAVDWFSSAGDVLDNISSWSKDGLVMRWGYLMRHTVAERTYTLMEPQALKGMTSSTALPSITLITEEKLRRRANPYGFGISWSSLSNTQKAILAALGLSRIR